jgi:hypothetical protein
MDSAAIKILQALLLAFAHPEVSLNPLEKDKFFEVGEQLQLDPDDWDFIWEGLNAIITNNPPLSQAFDTELIRLQNFPSNRQAELNPTEKEIAPIFYSPSRIEFRGYFKGEADLEGSDILNAVRRILKEDDPAETTKKLSWIDRIKKILPPQTN